jgi:2-dehydro-3-deoxy-D-arabinonate dehydratase
LTINRENNKVFEGEVGINQMKRSLTELVSYVYRESSFPHGCMIMTGTGIVPGNGFTLLSGDEIIIEIDSIGKLVNVVA